MKLIIEQLINGLTIGSFYALIALGYSMVYGVMKLINFAHGDLFALGSYLGYTLLMIGIASTTSFLGVWSGMIAVMLITAICLGFIGTIIERIAYRPIYPSGRLPAVVSALGVIYYHTKRNHDLWGARPQAYTAQIIPSSTFSVFGVKITLMQIIVLAVSFVLMGLLYYIIQKTTFGAAIRACALDRDIASLMGINIETIIFFIFALGPALGGMAGVMVGMYYRKISFIMGWNYGLKAFTATILGGIGNIPGAMIGGLLLGVLEMLGSIYISTAYKDVFVFLVLIIVLIIRPTGILGEKIAEKV